MERSVRHIHVLVLDDDPGDAVLIKRLLAQMPGWRCTVEHLNTQECGLRALAEGSYDICLCDYYLTASLGTTFIKNALAEGCDIPILMLTDQDNRAIDLEAMDVGASDYLAKNSLTTQLLERSIRYALERRLHHAELELLAHYDCLTSLPNRLLFHQHLETALSSAKAIEGHGVGLLFIDLDRFKLINDSFGHACGDDLLIQFSRRLRSCVRPSDMVARLGGDEFTILIHGEDVGQTAPRMAARIEQVMGEPFTLGECGALRCSASVGVRVSRDGNTTAEALMRDADTAMYRAKASGRGRAVVFDRTMHLASVSRLHKEQALKQALENAEFQVAFQPVINLFTGRADSVEALIQWNHPERGRLDASEFMPLAEELGLARDIHWWAMTAAAHHRAAWSQTAQSHGPPVSVNLSRRQLEDSDTAWRIAELLKEAGLRPADMIVEVSSTILSGLASEQTLADLNALGVSRFLDDFGTNHASLAHVESLPLAGLKIGSAYTSSLHTNPRRRAVIETILALGRRLDMTIIASGVETHEQRDILRSMGCQLGQGDLLAPKMSATSTIQLLRGVVA